MRPDPILEFTLGLVAIVVSLVVALLFAFPPSWLDSRHTAVAIFSNVGSLNEGAEVRENGYAVGNVVAIEPLGGFYRIRMKVRPDWRMAAGRGLTVEQANPLQAAGLSVARVCTVAATVDKPAAGCCPEKLVTPQAAEGEVALASCGRTPGLIDVALAATVKANDVITGLQTEMPGLMTKTTGVMTSLKALTDNALPMVDDQNRANMKSALANFNSGSKSMSELLTARQAELEASITNLNSVLQTTATKLPVILDNMQKASEDLKTISSQIRNQPTSLLHKRERRDPSFVEQSADKN